MSATSSERLRLACSDPRRHGTPLLLVHGFAHNRSVWEKLVDELPDGIRPIAVDLRGHGESPWSRDAAYDPHSYAADLPELLDALGIECACVAGHSLGGMVATLFAAGWPERITGLILVDASPALRSSGTAAVADDTDGRMRSYASIAEFREQLALTHPHGDPEILDRLAASGAVARVDGRYEPALDPGVLGGADATADLATLERALWAALAAVACPALLVRGGRSAVLSEKIAEEMVEHALPDAELVTLPSAGHALMIDDGPGLAAAIRGFVEGLGRSSVRSPTTPASA